MDVEYYYNTLSPPRYPADRHFHSKLSTVMAPLRNNSENEADMAFSLAAALYYGYHRCVWQNLLKVETLPILCYRSNGQVSDNDLLCCITILYDNAFLMSRLYCIDVFLLTQLRSQSYDGLPRYFRVTSQNELIRWTFLDVFVLS